MSTASLPIARGPVARAPIARAPLIDPFGRRIHYVRLSVTDRCNFRCVYCMPAEGIDWRERDELLSFEEMERVGRVLAECGVDKIRLTGGEPTVRRGIVGLVERLAALPGLETLAMTTNGWALQRLAAPLKEAGLTRLNVSLDTLDPERFRRMSRVGELAPVLAGIEELVRLEWFPIKLNCVVMKGYNDDEVGRFVRHFADLPVEIRFIEHMPFDAGGGNHWAPVAWEEVRAAIEAEGFALAPLGRQSGPAQRFGLTGHSAKVGTIAPLSAKFCSACNRIRISPEGKIRTCLAYEPDGVDLRALLRAGASDDDLEAALRRALERKPADHQASMSGGRAFEGAMIQIGG